MMSKSISVNPVKEIFLRLEGQRWVCRSGDVLGRAGTLAVDALRPVQVLSRRHLMVEVRDGTWYVTALPDARNDTYLDGVPMERGVPYPLSRMHTLQVDAFQFYLGTDDAMRPQWGGIPLGQTAPVRATAGLSDDTHPPACEGAWMDELPGAVLETDLRLNILQANRLALSALGAQALGRDLDEWTPERTMLRDRLLSLDAGESSGPVEAVLKLPGGPGTMELRASRTGDRLYILLRDVTPDRNREAELARVAGRLASQSGILAELSLSRAFQEGDVAKSLTLLAHRAAEALDCRRVSAWLKPDGTGAVSRKVVCQVCYDTMEPVKPGSVVTDLAYCPLFFEKLSTDEPWAIAMAGTPVLHLLQEMGFAQAGTGALLCVGLQQADGFYGVLCFERMEAFAGWTREDRQFTLCLASYGVLSLQTRERREALAKLQGSEARMTAELEEANRYIQRILPEPILEGPITAEWLMQPSEALGGDSFGYHWVGDLFVMYILDVVGHGTGMALLSISVLNNVRARLLLGESAMADPAGVLRDLNAAFPMENQNNMLFSMWYGVFDRRTRLLTYASAGHPPALLLHGEAPDDSEDYAALGTEAPSVGAMEGMHYTNGQTLVDRGAKLYIFTDGAFEIPLGPDREWTFDEFIAVVRSTRYMSGGEPLYLRKRIGALCSKAHFPDDFTVVRLTFEE